MPKEKALLYSVIDSNSIAIELKRIKSVLGTIEMLFANVYLIPTTLGEEKTGGASKHN